MKRVEIKEKSKKDLGGKLFSKHWLKAVFVCVIFGLLSGGLTINTSSIQQMGPEVLFFAFFLTFLASMISLLLLPLSYGFIKFFISVSRGEKAKARHLFAGYNDFAVQNGLTVFMMNLFISLWSLLFIIPGIIKSYSYSMTLYIRNDHPSMQWDEAITESRELMRGHKMRLFILDLSFIGWYILGTLCFGVGTLWVQAYHQTARANFYNDLIGYTPKEN